MYLLWFVLALLSKTLSPSVCHATGSPGLYSSYSIRLCYQNVDNGTRHLRIFSPNRLVILIVNGDEAELRVAGRAVGTFPVSSDQEVLWSPDSRALIITSSFGASGPTSAYIKNVPTTGLAAASDPTVAIRKDFARRHHGVECSESANVAGLGWSHGSSKALLLAQIPPTPECGNNWGYFDVYMLSVPEGKILRVYSMTVAVSRFRNLLGPGLRREVPRLE